MSQLVATATAQLRAALENAMNQAIQKGRLPQAPLPEIQLEVPADRSHGDWSCNAAMAGARTFRTAPQKIAQAIQENLDLSGTYFQTCEIAGPGFLNFTYDPRFYGEGGGVYVTEAGVSVLYYNEVKDDVYYTLATGKVQSQKFGPQYIVVEDYSYEGFEAVFAWFEKQFIA